jgi:hypothetical protein
VAHLLHTGAKVRRVLTTRNPAPHICARPAFFVFASFIMLSFYFSRYKTPSCLVLREGLEILSNVGGNFMNMLHRS